MSDLLPSVENIITTYQKLKNVVTHTPLMHNINFSERYNANIYLKREDLQIVRSYKIRGAYSKMSQMTPEEMKRGVVCASAGNHAQGVAYSCYKLKVKGKIFMPTPTPNQKVQQVRMFGKEYVEVVLIGDVFDDAYKEAMKDCNENNKVFVHPFDDEKVIAGQASVGVEILNDIDAPIDYLFVPIGGGGLASGVGSYFKHISPNTKIIGVEPAGAPAMKVSIKNDKNTTLEHIEKFVDGAAVQRVGEKTFEICKQVIDGFIEIPEGKVCTTILKLYNEEAIVAEPAGALTLSALDFYAEEIKGKNVVCVVSGSNNDITRTEEIKERSMMYEGLKHYFIVEFPQRAGALRELLTEVLGPNDDIVFFQYNKKNSREKGPAVLGIVLKHKDDFPSLIGRMEKSGIKYQHLNERTDLLNLLV